VLFVGRLDLISNAEFTRRSLSQLDVIEPPKRPARKVVRIDLAAIEEIDPSSLLYIVAQVDRLAELPGISVTGNFPRAPEVMRFFNEAGFLRHMRREKMKAPNRPTLELCSGHTSKLFDPEEWQHLYAFLAAHLPPGSDLADTIWNAFSECIENAHLHAFENKVAGGPWHALAIRASANAPARAVIVDLGVGIPRSVRLTALEMGRVRLNQAVRSITALWDRALELAGLSDQIDDDAVTELFSMIDTNDAACLWLAAQGLRTETQDRERGTGLPGLITAASETDGAVHLLSGQAAVTWQGGRLLPSTGRLTPLRGTVVCLEFTGQLSEVATP